MVGYPGMMQESIRKIEETRLFRLQQEIPRLNPAEKNRLLEKYHPDFRPGGMCEVRVGSNKGQRMQAELVNLLESYSCVEPDQINLAKVDHNVDVLVVGGGGGGTTAALIAHEQGAEVLLATKLRFGDSNTIMAEGGIAAATQSNDSLYLHFLDTMGGGRFQNKRDLVKTLVHDAPLIVEWLKDLGAMFDTYPNGNLVVSFAGGHCRRRVHSCKDLSGMEFMRVLRDELWNRRIDVLEFSPAVEILLDEKGNCAGAVLLNLETNLPIVVKAKAVILATGGIGRLHPNKFPTTNHYGATADGLVIAYRAGAGLLHMDAIQYHPTGAAWPPQMLGQLITEALRGNGAQLVNCKGERFINELETRDVTSSANIREVRDRKNGIRTPTGMEGVWLDTPLIDIRGGKGKLDRMFAGIVHRFFEYGIDPHQEPILVFPTQHYQNGGIEIDPDGKTDIPGLFAAGEVSGGVQGRNRLGGNSLVDIFVFGRRAGQTAALWAKEVQALSKITLEHVYQYNKELALMGVEKDKKSPLVLPDYSRPDNEARSYS
ncbi:succinate dehydrogenase / fumarate reductase flavoprotein subunit [Desulfotomaculum arcticum]|uniref:Succinate dehydrogenase / fumarate reductase flavoprotein subunit n=1 Tax=Desulfotruncus arcticus DSM 17038 TaxID=1121424 RepID=A0A1I2WP57_9FIRM|nr:FAD-binding protein [Desulfotruncus arcticus]SFH02467.1 succinate dehydrogenase / fumarate reductase flavoprotein subunit [Desulfotomaculum arcticum] [Desulfotruncus arcticus DSM 17038]